METTVRDECCEHKWETHLLRSMDIRKQKRRPRPPNVCGRNKQLAKRDRRIYDGGIEIKTKSIGDTRNRLTAFENAGRKYRNGANWGKSSSLLGRLRLIQDTSMREYPGNTKE